MKVIGLTGREAIVKVEKQTYCALCLRLIHRGEDAVEAAAGWLIHIDCGVASIVKEHTVWYSQQVKETKPQRKTRLQTKKVHESDGNHVCNFCHRLITVGDTFVNEDKRAYHNRGRNSCVTRVRRVINLSKASLY